MEEDKLTKIVGIVAKQLELENEISSRFISEALHAIKTFDSKHTEKGLAKLDKFGAMGVIIKADEKYTELLDCIENLKDDEIEKRLKLWEDIAVYSLMGKIVDSGEWN